MFKSKLLRRSLALTTALALWLFSYIPIAAEEETRLSFIARDVYVNGVLINNFELVHPFVIRQGSTYVPITPALGAALGFQVRVDKDARLIQLQPVAPNGQAVKEADLGCDLEDQTGLLAYGYTVAAVETFDNAEVAELSAKWRKIIDPVIWSLAGLLNSAVEQTVAPTPSTEILPLKETEILFVGEVPYLPLSAFRNSVMFDWDAHYDEVTGLYISTDPAVPAVNYYSAVNASYIQGRAAYIRGVRPELSINESYYYEYLFRHEAAVYDLDQDFLMAVSRTESSFQKSIESPSGAVGMMQIMPKSAAAYGISFEELKNPHVNLAFGTMYIRDRLWIFNGDVIKALSAYNQGVVSVSRGDYKTGFAEKCVSNEGVIKNWLSNRGYGHTFETRLAASDVRASAAQTD